MDDNTVKSKMMDLWMKTFQDSKDYVSLVFDNYYNPAFVRTEFEGERLVAAMMGVEYYFKFQEHKIRGLYLCGLATHPDFRGKGLMTRMMSDIEDAARKEGFAFTFLIPADKGLREFYRDRGYYEGIYNVRLSYTSIHDFEKEYFALLDNGQQKIADIRKRYFKTLSLSEENPYDSPQFCDSLIEFIMHVESGMSNLHLSHTRKDLKAVIEENRISKGDVIVVVDSDDKIVAAAFLDLSKDRGEATVLKIFSSSITSYYRCLHFIKTKYSDRSLRVISSTHSRKKVAVMEKGIVGDSSGISSSSHLAFVEEPVSIRMLAKCYGMIKILNLHEVLKFQAESYKASKFSILVREDDNGSECHFIADKGTLQIHCLNEGSQEEAAHSEYSINKRKGRNSDESPMLLSKSGICALLCRRPDSDNLIMEAFGLPALNLDMCLLLD